MIATKHTPEATDQRWSYSLRCYFSTCARCGRTIRQSGDKWRHLTPDEYRERGEK